MQWVMAPQEIYGMCYGNSLGANDFKNKSKYFWISQDFLVYRRYLQIFLSTWTCVYDWMANLIQRQPREIAPWKLKIMFSDIGGPTMVGSGEKENF